MAWCNRNWFLTIFYYLFILIFLKFTCLKFLRIICILLNILIFQIIILRKTIILFKNALSWKLTYRQNLWKITKCSFTILLSFNSSLNSILQVDFTRHHFNLHICNPLQIGIISRQTGISLIKSIRHFLTQMITLWKFATSTIRLTALNAFHRCNSSFAFFIIRFYYLFKRIKL